MTKASLYLSLIVPYTGGCDKDRGRKLQARIRPQSRYFLPRRARPAQLAHLSHVQQDCSVKDVVALELVRHVILA